MDLSAQLYSLISQNPLWNNVLYNDETIKIDIYYNSIGHPKKIHDEFGSLVTIQIAASAIIGQILHFMSFTDRLYNNH